MDRHKTWGESAGEAIEADLTEKLERTLKDFGYDLWIAVLDPKSGTRELRFGLSADQDVRRRRYCRLMFSQQVPARNSTPTSLQTKSRPSSKP